MMQTSNAAAVPGTRGLKPAPLLAADKPHGTRVKYKGGCRCDECRQCNTAYQRERALAISQGDTRGLVDAAPARQHMLRLREQGVGRRTIADVACLSLSIVQAIISGSKVRIRGNTERAILAITSAAKAEGTHVDARPYWRMLDELIACGHSRASLARRIIGPTARALQLKPDLMTLRNAGKVQRVYEQLRAADDRAHRDATKLLRELRAEGYFLSRIQAGFARVAGERWPQDPPTLDLVHGRLSLRACQVVQSLHAELTHAHLVD